VIERWPLVGRGDELAQIDRLVTGTGQPYGAVLFGEAGVGKTRLITDAVGALTARDVTVEWVRATDAARDIPLGSFAHLLARDDGARHREDLLHTALLRLRDRAGDGPFVLAVDDAHHLDPMSLALLHLAVTQAELRVVMSVRSGDELPSGLVGLWKDDLLRRIDVAPLTRQATEELVTSVLGPRVKASLLGRIWQLSRGNALFVRELVTTAWERRSSGEGGRVALVGHGAQERLRDLVDERLRLLTPDHRGALEVVAVGEQVPLVAAERLVPADDLDQLSTRGLIEVVDAGDVEVVQLVHPLHGEVLVGGLPPLRRRAVLRELVAAVGDLERFDRLRMATWQLESGQPGDPDLLVALAHEALGRLDHPLAERLARAAGGADHTASGLVLADALAAQGEVVEAQRILDGLDPAGPEEVAHVAVARGSNLFLGLDRSAEAFAVLEEAEVELGDHPAWQAECRSVAAQASMFAARYQDAGRLALAALDEPTAPESARVRATPVVMTVWGADGRLRDALDLVTPQLIDAARRHRQTVPWGELQLGMAQFQVLWWTGDAHALDELTARGLGPQIAHWSTPLYGVVSGFRGGALLARGRAGAALAEFERSVRALAEVDWFAQRPLAEAMRARAAVFAGDVGRANEAIAAADEAYAADPQRAARTLPFIELSRAWILAAEGSRSDAAGRCLALGTAMEHAARPLGVEALHDAVRLGHADSAREALDRLAATVDGPFAPVAARHAAAAAEEDADALLAVAGDLEDLGADLRAAEALRAAENLLRAGSRGASAADARRRADELLDRCGSPQSPALAPRLPAGAPLTRREHEVAALAARGRTSPEIAATLHLSTRTVDTHLARVYRKLMVEGRHELAAALDLGPRAGE
jgi:DNA-binding CsgD family transcriptional regulator/tetratricopeptide (TPR) repeat protein